VNVCHQIKQEQYPRCPYRYENECTAPICQKTIDEILEKFEQILSKLNHINPQREDKEPVAKVEPPLQTKPNKFNLAPSVQQTNIHFKNKKRK
jgi:hypothetical protein